MSNTPSRRNGHFNLADYRAKAAAEANSEPYILDVDTDHSITVPRPTGDVLMAIEEARTSREVIKHLAGAQADDLLKVLGPEDYTVMQAVSEDMRKHFGLELGE